MLTIRADAVGNLKIFHYCFEQFAKYSEKATKFCEILTLLFSYVLPVKSKVKILQNFVAFSEDMNFKIKKSE